jgi:SAM-dependent methyltransferase
MGASQWFEFRRTGETWVRAGRVGSTRLEERRVTGEIVGREALRAEAGYCCLNLGCGMRRMDEAVNLDITVATSPDVVHDLEVRPWPFADNRFRDVYAFDVIEHLDDFFGAMEEVHRICMSGARVHISVPHFSSRNAYTDPTHRRFFGITSMDYLEAGHALCFYTGARFRVVSRRIFFEPSLLNSVVLRLANRYPERYERRFAWIFPAWFLSFELEVLK